MTLPPLFPGWSEFLLRKEYIHTRKLTLHLEKTCTAKGIQFHLGVSWNAMEISNLKTFAEFRGTDLPTTLLPDPDIARTDESKLLEISKRPFCWLGTRKNKTRLKRRHRLTLDPNLTNQNLLWAQERWNRIPWALITSIRREFVRKIFSWTHQKSRQILWRRHNRGRIRKLGEIKQLSSSWAT